MRFSIRFGLVVITFCAIALAFGWPIYKSNTESFEVSRSKRTIGGRLGWVTTPILIQSTGNPSFIFNEASSKFIPYLDGASLPYLVVLTNENNRILFNSGVRADPTNVSAASTTTLNSTKIRIEYRITNVAIRSSKHPPAVVELLKINESNVKLDRGRILFLKLDGDKLLIRQTKTDEIPAELFRNPRLKDKERTVNILRWWAKNKTMPTSHLDDGG